MKVLFVHDGPMLSNSAKDIFYGVHYTDEIVERYSFFGNVVTFLMRNKVISDNDGLKYTKLTHKAFRFIEVPNFKSITSKIKQFQANKIIKQAVNEHDFIIVRLPSANGLMAKKIAVELGKPVLVEVVACVYDALWNYDWRGKLLAKYKYHQYRKAIKSASHVIYVTQHFLQSRYPTNGYQIGCSDVVINIIDETVLTKRFEKINKKSENIVLGTVAAIDVVYKGQADIIKVLSNLKQLGFTNFKYKIVGQGNPIRLQQLITSFNLNEQVEILGSMPHNQIFDFMDSLDLYIQPSKQEGLPRAVIEAISRACPVIATNIAGHPELINKSALFEPGNFSQIEGFLLNFNKLPIRDWAAENFKTSKNYHSNFLNQKRIEFYNRVLTDFNLTITTQN